VHGSSSVTGGSTVDRQSGTGLTERQWRTARHVQAPVVTSRTGRGRQGDGDSSRRTVRYDGAGRRSSRPFIQVTN